MKLITLDNLKTFLDKLLEQISTDVYSKKEVDDKLEKNMDEVIDLVGKNVEALIEEKYYDKNDCNGKFQPKGDYALKSDIPKAQDLTPYAKKSDLINKIEKKDIYQENFIKLPDGTMIGIETKSGGGK